MTGGLQVPKVAAMTYRSSGAVIKRSVTDLVRGGCRIEKIAHDPVAVTFITSQGQRSALRLDDRLYVVDGEGGLASFYSLDAALAAAVSPIRAAAS
jgi:hypothetical protein